MGEILLDLVYAGIRKSMHTTLGEKTNTFKYIYRQMAACELTLTFYETGTSTVCTPEQYKDCADPALGKPTHYTHNPDVL